MIYTGTAVIMRCGRDQEMVNPLDSCGNYKLEGENGY
jgi:hypothetical protein